MACGCVVVSGLCGRLRSCVVVCGCVAVVCGCVGFAIRHVILLGFAIRLFFFALKSVRIRNPYSKVLRIANPKQREDLQSADFFCIEWNADYKSL